MVASEITQSGAPCSATKSTTSQPSISRWPSAVVANAAGTEAIMRSANPAPPGKMPADDAVTAVTQPGGGRGAAGIYIYSRVHGLDIKKLRPDYPGQNTVIYDRYGGKLATVASVQNRTHVTSSQIWPWLKEATVAIEDRRFYQHGGVDYLGV